MATLLTYNYIVIPQYNLDNAPKNLKNTYNKNCRFLKSMNLEMLLPKINKVILREGIYYGFMKVGEKDQPIFYQLPVRYCRTRFNDEFGLPVLELNAAYFDNIAYDEAERKSILELFPKYVQALYRKKKVSELWIEIPAVEGGMCFMFNEEGVPPLIAGMDAIADLQGARDREAERDKNELQKLLIQKLPVDKSTGELLFSLEEAQELHQSVCNMVGDNDTIDVLTTYADISLESVQEPDSAANSSTSRLQKYTSSVYDDMGITSQIFNSSNGSTAITYSIKKDISIMFSWSKQYEIWLNVVLRNRTKSENNYCTIKFLPISTIFQKDSVDMYLKAAQYGYPKTMVSSALGLDAIDLMELSDYENKTAKLDQKLVPLNNSYTQSSNDKNSKNNEKTPNKTTSTPNLSNEGGRPTKSIEERADRTNENIDGAT